jgi:hypothetical protein
VRQITQSDLAQFGAYMRQQTGGGMSIGNAQNQLTLVNVAMELLRRSEPSRATFWGDTKAFGHRLRRAGAGRVRRAVDALVASGWERSLPWLSCVGRASAPRACLLDLSFAEL